MKPQPSGDKPRSHLVLAYTAYLLLAGLGTAGLGSSVQLAGGWHHLFAMFCLVVLTEALPVPLPRIKGTVSVSFPIIHAVAIIFGPIGAAWVATLGSLRPRDLRGEVELLPFLFNRLQLGLAAYASGWLFQAMGGSMHNLGTFSALLAVAFSGLLYLVVNVTAITLYSALKERQPARKIWLASIIWALPNTLALLPVTFLFAATYKTLGLLAPLVLVLPLLMARYSYQRFVDIRNQYIDTIRSLAAALEAKDSNTYGHADRVSRLSVAIGKKLGLGEARLEKLLVAGILHDIGKIGVPDAVLNKKGKFTQEEFAQMAQHPDIGAHIIANVQELGAVADWIRHHHERVDGQGYPAGLVGEQIPLEARILAVADAFDAMTSQRPYRQALTAEEALNELQQCAGSQFDPHVVEAFLQVAAQPGFLESLPASADSLGVALQQRQPSSVSHLRLGG